MRIYFVQIGVWIKAIFDTCTTYILCIIYACRSMTPKYNTMYISMVVQFHSRHRNNLHKINCDHILFRMVLYLVLVRPIYFSAWLFKFMSIIIHSENFTDSFLVFLVWTFFNVSATIATKHKAFTNILYIHCTHIWWHSFLAANFTCKKHAQ